MESVHVLICIYTVTTAVTSVQGGDITTEVVPFTENSTEITTEAFSNSENNDTTTSSIDASTTQTSADITSLEDQPSLTTLSEAVTGSSAEKELLFRSYWSMSSEREPVSEYRPVDRFDPVRESLQSIWETQEGWVNNEQVAKDFLIAYLDGARRKNLEKGG